MKNYINILILIVVFISCSKPISINDLESVDGVAINPGTGEPFTGEASLDFYNGGTRMIGSYELGIKSGQWKYYVQNTENKYYDLTFVDGNIVKAIYNDSDRQ